MSKKRLIAALIILVLISSYLNLAQEEVNTNDTCGFWCKVNQFLFGSAENRAGKGWFDRDGALVGMAGKNLISCKTLRSAYSSGYCQQINGDKTNVFSCTSAGGYAGGFSCKGLTLSNGKLKESDKFQWWTGDEMNSDEFSQSKVTSEEYLWHETAPELVKTPEDVQKLKKAGLTTPASAVAFSKSTEFKGLSGGTISTLVDQIGSTNGAKDWGQWYQAQITNPIIGSNKVKETDLPKLQKTFGEKTASASTVLSSPKVKSADDAVSVYNAAGNDIDLAQAMLKHEGVTDAETAVTWLQGNTPITKEKLAEVKASVKSEQESSTSKSYVPDSLKDKISQEEYEQYNSLLMGTNVPTKQRDATIEALVDAKISLTDLSTKVQSCSADGGECQFGDITIEVKNGALYDVVSVPAGEDELTFPAGPTEPSTPKEKTTTPDSKDKESTPTGAPKPSSSLTVPAVAPPSPVAPAPPTPQPKYEDIFSDSLGDTPFSKKIKEKYFKDGKLNQEYELVGAGEIKTKAIKETKSETALTHTKKDNGMGVVIDHEKDKEKGTVLPENTHYLFLSGKEIAKQTDAQKEEGKVTIYEGEESHTVFMKESDTFVDSLNFAEQQLFYEDEEDKSNGVIKSALQVGDGKITYTDAGEETQQITDMINNQIIESEGDWDKDKNIFTPSDGIIYEVDKAGNKGKAKYLADYDYKDKKLDTVELFDPLTGDYLGDDINPSDGIAAPTTKPPQATKTVLSSIYAAATSVKDYPALSKVLGLSDWWKGVLGDIGLNYVANADQNFAPMLGTNWFPSWICDRHWDLEPEGTAMIKTPSGTYQAVAHIEGERSAGKSPILCSRNPDQEAEQEWLCDDYQVCMDNSFCYADKDQNSKPDDEEKQLNGYFYKITWGVSAPSDETFTPFIDENGVAVSFNVVIKNTNTVEPLYSKDADIGGPIELKNGDSDRDVILHYSPNLYTEVCIKWENAPASIREGFTGSFSGAEAIGDVCFDLVTSSVGEVNWESSGKPSSTKAADPEVSLSTGW